jgi:hypothetical protein
MKRVVQALLTLLLLAPAGVFAQQGLQEMLTKSYAVIPLAAKMIVGGALAAGFSALLAAGWAVWKHGKGQGVMTGGNSQAKAAAYGFIAGATLLFIQQFAGSLGVTFWDNPTPNTTEGNATVQIR